MDLNFKEALTTLSRALPLVLFRTGIFVAGGFAVIVFFGVLLFVLRPKGGAGPLVALLLAVPLLLGGWACARLLRRFFLFRHRAALLFMFSGRAAPAPGLSGAIQEAGRLFPAFPAWAGLERDLRRALIGHAQRQGRLSAPVAGLLGQAVLALAFSRGGPDVKLSAREGLALFLRHGDGTRRMARRWLGFSAMTLAFLFLCLALPNWFFFKIAGAPEAIGIALAVVIAWFLHQAFIYPLALAGVSASLLAETRGREPDANLCEKIVPLLIL